VCDGGRGSRVGTVVVGDRGAGLSRAGGEGVERGDRVGAGRVGAALGADGARAASGTFAVNAKTKNKDLALKFIDFMAQPDTMNAWATAGGSLPAFPNDKFTAGPELAPFIEFQKAGKTVPFMDQLWPNPTVQNVHLTGVQDMFSGKLKPADVLAQMDAAYKK
jgi:ABC-type glycerol-3-phosphate transport system substrate-binding protein